MAVVYTLLGTAISAVVGGAIVFGNTNRDRKKAESGYKSTLEDRLPLAMLSGMMFPVTMFWFAWSAEYNSVHCIVPTLTGVFLGTAIRLIFRRLSQLPRGHIPHVRCERIGR